jgi:hypothetical protein
MRFLFNLKSVSGAYTRYMDASPGRAFNVNWVKFEIEEKALNP